MFQNKSWLVGVIMGISFATSGCGEGYKAAKIGGVTELVSDGGGAVSEPIEQVDLKALDEDLTAVEVSMVEVESEIGKIDIPLLGSSGATSKTTEQGLDKPIRQVFDRLLEAVTKVFSKVDELEDKVRDQMAKLDPTNPLHAVALIKLNEALAYLQQLKAKLGEKFRAIVGKIDGLVSSVDSKIASMDMKNPLTWAAAIAWQIVRTTIIEYRDKLLALAP